MQRAQFFALGLERQIWHSLGVPGNVSFPRTGEDESDCEQDKASAVEDDEAHDGRGEDGKRRPERGVEEAFADQADHLLRDHDAE